MRHDITGAGTDDAPRSTGRREFHGFGSSGRRPAMPDPLAAPESGKWPALLPILCYLALFGVMTWPWLAGYVSIPWDSKAQFLPQIQFLAQSLARGEWPWWNPYVFSGQPQVADPQSMLFSPPYLLLALVDASPGPWAQDVTLIATMAAGGVGLMLWFRDRGWHWAGAIVAALAFSFGAAMAWRIQHTGQVLSLAYMPWALLLLDRAVERGSLAAGLGAGIVAGAIVLGRDQVALLIVYLLACRVLWLWLTAAERRRCFTRSLAPLLAGAVGGGALVALPVAMTYALALGSNRPEIDFAGAGAGSLHPAQLVTFAIPQLFGAAGDMADYWGPPSFAWVGTGLFTAQNVGQLYIGALPLIAILAAAASGTLWDRDIRFFTLAGLFALLYGLGWYTPAFRAMYEVMPGVTLYRRPADAVFLIGGLGAILAGYAVHAWFASPWRRPTKPVAAAVACVMAAAAIAAISFGFRIDRLGRLPLPLTLAAASFALALAAAAYARPRLALSPWHAALALAAVTAVDLGINNGPGSSSALPPSTFDMLDPESRDEVIRTLEQRVVDDEHRRDRVELAGLGFHWPNASMTHRLENTLGYNPVRLGLYSRATGAEDHVGLPDQRKFSALMPSYRSRLSDLLGLRFIATGAAIEEIDKTLKPGELPLILTSGERRIYENPSALPRVLFATEARAADFEAIVATGRWPEFDPTSTVLLPSAPSRPGSRRAGEARILSYTTTRIEVETAAPDGGWLVLNDVWHPWWEASIDGISAPIERANVLFRAVEMPAGRHRVVFEFRPLAGLYRQIRNR